MIISYSELVSFQTCKRKWYYSFYKGLSSEASDAVDTGNKGHSLLQSFYTLLQEGMPKEDALKIIKHQASNLMAKDKLDYNLVVAWTMVDNYIRATEFKASAVIVENRFLISASEFFENPLFKDIQIGFTPDVVFERTGNWIDIEDAKFVQRAWSSKKIERFSQIKVYQLFLEFLHYRISRGIIRFFNVKTGKIETKSYEMLKPEKEILKRELEAHVLDLVKYRLQTPESLEKSPRTLNYGACQFCDFNFPCTLEAQGKDATKTLALYDKRRYDYSV